MQQLSKSRLIGIVLLLIGIALFIRSWLFGASTDAADGFIGLTLMAILCFSIIGMVRHLECAWREWHLYQTEDGKRFQRIALNPAPELPKRFADWQDEIFDLGFAPLGAYTAKNKMVCVWVYVDPDKTICANISSIPPMYEFIEFSTYFEDGFGLETTYQFDANLNIDQPTAFTANLVSSITETYQYHLHHYDRFLAEHGTPQTQETVEDFLPTPETNKEHMRGIYANRLQSRLKLAGIFITFGLASFMGMFATSLFGMWMGGGLAALGSGLALLLLDYDAIAGKFRPVDEHKARKGKIMSDNKKLKSSLSRGSIGDISARLGYDVRDLYVSGYSQAQVDGVLNGDYTLQELFNMPPDKKSQR